MNTPRTDAAILADLYPILRGEIVTADFARQLETELAAMTALADQMAEALRESRNTIFHRSGAHSSSSSWMSTVFTLAPLHHRERCRGRRGLHAPRFGRAQ